MPKVIKGIAFISTIVLVLMIIIYINFRIDIFLTLAITFGTIAYHFIMRLIVGCIVNIIMNNQADYNKKWYCLRKFEIKLYEVLKVKRWKKRMPTYDPSLFSLEEHTFDEIAQAMCQAEIVHEIIVLFSFLPLVLVPVFGAFIVFLLTSLFSAMFDMIFVIMQRYNRPRIVEIAKRQIAAKNRIKL